jgi:membrane protein YdbS with pleckstrin-like domain
MARVTPIDLPVAKPTRGMSVWLIVLIVGSLLALLGIGIVMQTLTPDDPTPLYIAIACAVFGAVLPLALLRIIRRYRITVENGVLVVKTGVGTRRLALANLQPHGLQVIDLEQHPELKTCGKIWMAKMPGIKTGFYALRNGERAIMLVTDTRRVSRLRSDVDNVSVLLSLQNPETLKALLER